MQAIVYGHSTLKLEEVEKPVPADNEVLIKVRAASVNPLDYHFLRHAFLRPVMAMATKVKTLRPGRDVAGQVEAVGKNVTQFKAGDEVFGACNGAFAEYACARESAFATKPSNVSFEQAASVPVAGLTALQAFRDKAQVQPGQKVLINGAAGGVGTFAVQIAKTFGADVTGVCSTRNVEMVRSIGADQVIDYTKEDFTKSAQRYDLMLDNVGNHSLSKLRRVIKPKGKYVMVGGPSGRWIDPLPRAFNALVLSRFVSQDMGMFLANLNQKDLTVLRDLMEAGKVTPVIDRRYKLNEVRAAIRYLEAGHARGKVVITMD